MPAVNFNKRKAKKFCQLILANFSEKIKLTLKQFGWKNKEGR
jgi:hypothetical protein